MIKQYLLRIAALISQIINCVFLLGSQDQTICSRCYVNRNKRYWKIAYTFFNSVVFWQDNHCKESFKRDVEFAIEILGDTSC